MSCFLRYRNRLIVFSKMSKSNKTVVNFSRNKRNKETINPTVEISKSLGSVKFEILPTPVKSESDKKEYKVIKLENGLTACLISDKSPIIPESDSEESDMEEGSSAEETEGTSEEDEDEDYQSSFLNKSTASEQKMAAAGLCIGVGSFSDPKDVPGMAHFLEHMVFMGSAKYPGENDFDAFINKGGGSDNASTDAETTCFYFECLEKNLEEALDRFAQFFIAPLMKREAMTREREAIESEFQMAIPLDSSRKEQLLCSLAKNDSPVNAFSWGNLITLRDNVSDDKLYNGVHEFRKRHYSAHRMTLAVQARMPMETLESFVVEYFSDIPNNNLPADDFSQYSSGVFDTPEFCKILYVKPQTDLCQVDLTWALPSLRNKYKSKPHQYISYLIGDEGKGSLLSYLRKKVWVLATSVGNTESGSEHNSIYSFFTITMNLTDEGLVHLNEVIETVFSYIQMLQKEGPQQRIFDEVKAIYETSFRFANEETAIDLVEDLSEAMHFYPPEDFVAGSELFYDYDPQGIKDVLNHLRPDNVNIMVLSKTVPEDVKYDKVEKWFGTEYTSKEIPKIWLEKWNNAKPLPDLQLPPKNNYLTTDFQIMPELQNNPDYPKKILSTPVLELWYRRDQSFKLPIAYYYFYLISPMAVESAESSCMVDTFMNLLVIDIAEELYPATSADLIHSFSSFEKGFTIKVSGYNQKLPVLVDVIAKYLITLADRVTEDMFNAVKEKLVKNYYNKLLKPSTLAKDLRLHLLVNNHFTPAERYSAMLEIKFDGIKNFIRDYMKNVYIKILVQGNVSQDVATETANNFVKTLQCNPITENAYPKFRVVQVPKGEICCKVKSFNNLDSNSIITNYYQSGPFTIRNSVIIEIIMMIIEEPLFDMLRTKEQLGYHVYCSIRDTFGILGYTITVNAQATKNTTEYVDTRIEKFLSHTKELLSKMDEEEFDQTRNDLIKMKKCVDVHLKEEVDRNWSEIISDDYVFDRIKQEIAMIEDIKLDEVRKWWEEHNYFGKKDNFRKLSIQVVGFNTKETNAKSSGEKHGDAASSEKITISLMGADSQKENRDQHYFIENIQQFKENLFLYPVANKKTSNM